MICKNKWGFLYSTLILTSILFNSTTINAASSYVVDHGGDAGVGTLRDALDSDATVIVIDPSVASIAIESTLVYEGFNPLMIIGSGQTVYGDLEDPLDTLLEVTNGADLSISNLNFTVDTDTDYSADFQGGGKGIFVKVPDDREGTVNLALTHVSVSNVGLHGVHVLDCDVIACGAGGGGAGDGSPASINVSLVNVTVDNVGNGGFDSDGVRVDDRGEGDIIFNAVDSTFINVGADGVELDEGDAGDVIVNVRNSVFENNGAYCFGVDVDEPADPTCVEDDEGELVLDLDDGFDIDEAGEGSISGQITNSLVNDNFDEGLDIDEEDAGDIHLDLGKIMASNNGDEGIKASEEGEGDVTLKLSKVTTMDNDDDGIQLEQEGAGDINVKVNATTSLYNKKVGLKVSQDGTGDGSLKVRGSDIDSIKSDVEEI